MKTKNLLCGILVLILMASCSKTKQKGIDETTTEDILVEESPWTFSSYQHSFIEDDGGSSLGGQTIAADMNRYLAGVRFTFNADGTGYLEIPEQEREDWVWTLGQDVLLTFSDTKNDSYSFFSADRNQMTFESRTTTLHTKDSIQYSVTHVGKYFFD